MAKFSTILLGVVLVAPSLALQQLQILTQTESHVAEKDEPLPLEAAYQAVPSPLLKNPKETYAYLSTVPDNGAKPVCEVVTMVNPGNYLSCIQAKFCDGTSADAFCAQSIQNGKWGYDTYTACTFETTEDDPFIKAKTWSKKSDYDYDYSEYGLELSTEGGYSKFCGKTQRSNRQKEWDLGGGLVGLEGYINNRSALQTKTCCGGFVTSKARQYTTKFGFVFAPKKVPMDHNMCQECEGYTKPWTQKCSWTGWCAKCSICSETCQDWCESHTKSWEDKCKMISCSPCAACG